MTASAQDVIDTLRSIDATLIRIAAHLGALQPTTAHVAPSVPLDVDLDGKYGNPIVKAKDPRDWIGESQQGKRLSECPPEYLDMVAARLDYFAEKEENAKKKQYNRLDAARARGWASRLRAGWTPPPHDGDIYADAVQQRATNDPPPMSDDDIPF